MDPPRGGSRRRRRAVFGRGALLAAGALLVAGAISALTAGGERGARNGDAGDAGGAEGSRSADPQPEPGGDDGVALLSAGWEEAAETVVADLRGLLDGRARPGAFAEAQAEAARQDLALHPPARDRVRRMLLGSEQERRWALAALSARPALDDDLVRLVLRSHRPEDDAVTRLLGAEIAASIPPDLLSPYGEELVQAFASEENPLVLAVALPALEQLDEERLQALVRAQVETASPSMLPVLVGLARDRLGADALADVGILVNEGAGGD